MDLRNTKKQALRGMFADDALMSKLESVTQGVKPTVTGYEKVLVNISPEDSLVFARFIDCAYDSMASVMAMAGGEMTFTKGSYARYLLTLVNARCEYVATGRAVVRPYDDVIVPAFMTIVMNQIGKCTNDELGIQLIPNFVSDTKDGGDAIGEEDMLIMSIFGADEETPESLTYMSRDEISNMSLKLRLMRTHGFVMSEQPFDRSRDGDWEFMALQILSNQVMAVDDNATPVHAMLASVLSLKQVQSVMLPRVNYGPMTFFSTLVDAVAGPVH